MSLLDVQDLHVHFCTRSLDGTPRTARALNGVSFSVEPGQMLGLVGETGAGKSLTATAIMGLLRSPARLVRGRALLDGRDLLAMPPAELHRLRGQALSLVVQSPKSALDPLTRLGDQLTRIQRVHGRPGGAAARDAAVHMLRLVGIPDPARRMAAWPHELSGGMAQRVLIALALINQPRLLIADEPTTGLDVTVQAQIMDLLRHLAETEKIGIVIITHDLGVVAQYCDNVAVMFAGSIVENGPVDQVFTVPTHPYTAALLRAAPERLQPGHTSSAGNLPPNLFALPDGCSYRLRCPGATPVCGDPPPIRHIAAAQASLCHHAHPMPLEQLT